MRRPSRRSRAGSKDARNERHPRDRTVAVGRAHVARARRPRARRCTPGARGWPGGARCAVALSFDSDHETIPLRDGESARQAVARASTAPASRRAAHPRHARPSTSVPASFFMPAVSALLHPDEAAPRRRPRATRSASTAGSTSATCCCPRGRARPRCGRPRHAGEAHRRAPGRHPHAVVGLRPTHAGHHRASMGLLYDSSLMADDDCYELLARRRADRRRRAAGGVDPRRRALLQHGPLRRAAALHAAARRARHLCAREFDAACAEGGLFQLTMHPHIIGHRSRIWHPATS